MESNRMNYRNKLWCAKEEVKDLERLLEEAKLRLDREFENNGGRNFWEWVWRWLGYYY